MGRKLGEWGRNAEQEPAGADTGDWEEDHELQEALQRSIKDQGAQGATACRHIHSYICSNSTLQQAGTNTVTGKRTTSSRRLFSAASRTRAHKV